MAGNQTASDFCGELFLGQHLYPISHGFRGQRRERTTDPDHRRRHDSLELWHWLVRCGFIGGDSVGLPGDEWRRGLPSETTLDIEAAHATIPIYEGLPLNTQLYTSTWPSW